MKKITSTWRLLFFRPEKLETKLSEGKHKSVLIKDSQPSLVLAETQNRFAINLSRFTTKLFSVLLTENKAPPLKKWPSFSFSPGIASRNHPTSYLDKKNLAIKTWSDIRRFRVGLNFIWIFQDGGGSSFVKCNKVSVRGLMWEKLGKKQVKVGQVWENRRFLLCTRLFFSCVWLFSERVGKWEFTRLLPSGKV